MEPRTYSDIVGELDARALKVIKRRIQVEDEEREREFLRSRKPKVPSDEAVDGRHAGRSSRNRWLQSVDFTKPSTCIGRGSDHAGGKTFHFDISSVNKKSAKSADALREKAKYPERDDALESNSIAKDELIAPRLRTIATQLISNPVLNMDQYIGRDRSVEVLSEEEAAELKIPLSQHGKIISLYSNISMEPAERDRFWLAVFNSERNAGQHRIHIRPHLARKWLTQFDETGFSEIPAVIREELRSIARQTGGQAKSTGKNEDIVIRTDSDRDLAEVDKWLRSASADLKKAVVCGKSRSGRVMYKINFELCQGLDAQGRARVLNRTTRLLRRAGVMFTAVVHSPDPNNNELNYHIHVVFYDRPCRLLITDHGEMWDFEIEKQVQHGKGLRSSYPYRQNKIRFIAGKAASSRELGTINESLRAVAGRDIPKFFRSTVARIQNKELERFRCAARLSALSYKTMGNGMVPTQKLYAYRSALENAGVSTELGDRNADVSWNNRYSGLEHELTKLAAVYAEESEKYRAKLRQLSEACLLLNERDVLAKLAVVMMRSCEVIKIDRARAMSRAERVLQTTGRLTEAMSVKELPPEDEGHENHIWDRRRQAGDYISNLDSNLLYMGTYIQGMHRDLTNIQHQIAEIDAKCDAFLESLETPAIELVVSTPLVAQAPGVSTISGKGLRRLIDRIVQERLQIEIEHKGAGSPTFRIAGLSQAELALINAPSSAALASARLPEARSKQVMEISRLRQWFVDDQNRPLPSAIDAERSQLALAPQSVRTLFEHWGAVLKDADIISGRRPYSAAPAALTSDWPAVRKKIERDCLRVERRSSEWLIYGLERGGVSVFSDKALPAEIQSELSDIADNDKKISAACIEEILTARALAVSAAGIPSLYMFLLKGDTERRLDAWSKVERFDDEKNRIIKTAFGRWNEPTPTRDPGANETTLAAVEIKAPPPTPAAIAPLTKLDSAGKQIPVAATLADGPGPIANTSGTLHTDDGVAAVENVAIAQLPTTSGPITAPTVTQTDGKPALPNGSPSQALMPYLMLLAARESFLVTLSEELPRSARPKSSVGNGQAIEAGSVFLAGSPNEPHPMARPDVKPEISLPHIGAGREQSVLPHMPNESRIPTEPNVKIDETAAGLSVPRHVSFGADIEMGQHANQFRRRINAALSDGTLKVLPGKPRNILISHSKETLNDCSILLVDAGGKKFLDRLLQSREYMTSFAPAGFERFPIFDRDLYREKVRQIHQRHHGLPAARKVAADIVKVMYGVSRIEPYIIFESGPNARALVHTKIFVQLERILHIPELTDLIDDLFRLGTDPNRFPAARWSHLIPVPHMHSTDGIRGHNDAQSVDGNGRHPRVPGTDTYLRPPTRGGVDR